MKNRLKIGIDLDDVIWQFLTAWLDRYNEMYDDNINPQDIKDWDISKYATKCSPESMFKIMEQPDFWSTVKPMLGATRVLNYLNNQHDLYIVTSTSYVVASKKLARFFELFPFIGFRQIITTYNKQLIKLDVLIDDYPANLCDGDYVKVLFSQPHNKWCTDESMIRVNNWEDVINVIDRVNEEMIDIGN